MRRPRPSPALSAAGLLLVACLAGCIKSGEAPAPPAKEAKKTKAAAKEAKKMAPRAKAPPPRSLPPRRVDPLQAVVERLPSWYRPLFERGSTFTYRYDYRGYTANQLDPRPREHRAAARVACKVAKVEQRKRQLASRITCAMDRLRSKSVGLEAKFLPWTRAVVYLADRRGLWVLQRCEKRRPFDCVGDDLPRRPDLGARPRTRGRRITTERLDPRSSEELRISYVRVGRWRTTGKRRRRRRSYCHSLLTGRAGEDVTVTRCFAREHGVISEAIRRNNGLQPRFHDRAEMKLVLPTKPD